MGQFADTWHIPGCLQQGSLGTSCISFLDLTELPSRLPTACKPLVTAIFPRRSGYIFTREVPERQPLNTNPGISTTVGKLRSPHSPLVNSSRFFKHTHPHSFTMRSFILSIFATLALTAFSFAAPMPAAGLSPVNAVAARHDEHDKSNSLEVVLTNAITVITPITVKLGG